MNTQRLLPVAAAALVCGAALWAWTAALRAEEANIVGTLITKLKDTDAKARAAAAAELGKSGAAALPAVPPLIEALADAEVKTAAAAALKEITGAEVKELSTTDTGLKYLDYKAGDGKAAQPGDTAEVHYTGWLTNGKKFDSSRDRGETFQFPLGARRVIAGWDQGVAGMKPGQRRLLVIPARLAYGDRDVGNGLIPAGSTLVFDVELISAR
jgi:FKBP-type peptidyl-prolyl cis-trans isomerase